MKFELDYKVHVADDVVDSAALAKGIETYRDALKEPGAISGFISVRVDGATLGEEYGEPLLRLVAEWVRKLPWILGGDTETVPFRNSEQCYGFMPAGDSVELSLFEGTETEIEEYIIEPTTVWMNQFASETVNLAERLVELVRGVTPELLDTDEDCRDLVTSLEEASKAWRDHQLHQRR